MTETQEGRRLAVHALARAAGIVDEYYDISRDEVRQTSAHTAETILRAMGLDVSSEAAALDALASVRRPWTDAICDAVRVVRGNEGLAVHLALPWQCESFAYSVEVRREDGEVLRTEAKLAGNAGHSPRERRLYRMETGFMLPHGYHDARVRVDCGGEQLEATQRLIVTPWKCVDARQKLDGRRLFGYWANLYAVRGQHDFGMGNLSTLAEVLQWATMRGHAGCDGNAPSGRGESAAFVGLNPLHALRNRGADVSPYSPSSRLFRNILYIDLRNIPELAMSEEARRLLSEKRVVDVISELRASRLVQHEQLLDLLLPVLRSLHGVFFERVRSGSSDRAREYLNYCERQGTFLDSFATFEALTERMRTTGDAATVADWRRWPERLRDIGDSEVRDFASQNDRDLDFHRYLQFELDRQLGDVQRSARAGGMAIGLYGDLALASSGSGFDAWAFRNHFVQGMSVGAPADAFAIEGQTWGCPPVSPMALREHRYEYWIRVLRAAFEHCGMLRIDHVMGMWRQFWVPEGSSPREGAYVQYPADDLLGILALESERASALVVGEDLGTVPSEVRPAMRDRAILSSKVLYFERDGSGSFATPEKYEEISLASVNTHDLPPLAGWWLGVDLMSRYIGSAAQHDVELRNALMHREWERKQLISELVNRALIDEEAAARLRKIGYGAPIADVDREAISQLVSAVHQLLCRSSSVLVSLSLDDVALETEAVNRPGVSMDDWRSWSRKMDGMVITSEH